LGARAAVCVALAAVGRFDRACLLAGAAAGALAADFVGAIHFLAARF
jgi:hypothetical protein